MTVMVGFFFHAERVIGLRVRTGIESIHESSLRNVHGVPKAIAECHPVAANRLGWLSWHHCSTKLRSMWLLSKSSSQQYLLSHTVQRMRLISFCIHFGRVREAHVHFLLCFNHRPTTLTQSQSSNFHFQRKMNT